MGGLELDREMDWLAMRLRLRPHHGRTVTLSGVLPVEASVTATLQAGWGVAPADASTEERLAWLEHRMAEAGRQLGTLSARHMQEVTAMQTAAREEKTARMAEDQRTRESIANLAGGGLRLQAWGVACLLAGTVMTAIW
jgi:hypothetical protein